MDAAQRLAVLALSQTSWTPLGGHAQPQAARPTDSAATDHTTQTMRLPVMMPSAAPVVMRYGEK